MECDWEVEIAPDAPVIDGAWQGFLDLRTHPARIAQIDEAIQFPALADALTRLNGAASSVYTSKCDVWAADPASLDPDEMDSDAANCTSALACYIDLLPARSDIFSTLDEAAALCRQLCLTMHARPLRQCRVDAVIRRAFLTPEQEALGVTVYLTACGPAQPEASAALARALAAMAESMPAVGDAAVEPSKYNENIVGE